MSASLEPEIARVLERAGLHARCVRLLSTIQPTGSGRSVYRIDLEGGRTLKARRLDDEATAHRLYAIRRELPAAFAPALACEGRVLLEEWIDGAELDRGCPSAAQIGEAAALLASLHARTTLVGETLLERRDTRDWRARSEADLQSLVDASALDAAAADQIRAQLDALDPRQALFGLIHSDFCGENMLIDGAGRLRVIDNERLRVDALGFDVARCWYRWPLPPPAWEDLRAAYASALRCSEPLDAFPFWQRVVLVKSAALRQRIDPTRAHVPLDRLRALAAEPAARATQD